ncbi:RNA-directed DNA polymerase, eukaryota [Tanacetum coccineum]
MNLSVPPKERKPDDNILSRRRTEFFIAHVMIPLKIFQWNSIKLSQVRNGCHSGGSILDVKEDIIRVGQLFKGTWLSYIPKSFIAIYAPQQTSCKRKLWDYISNIVGRWNGESIIMGDFNEVRSSEERRGSCFNPYSARYFDRFISNAGLVDVTLEGYAFTWAHPRLSKMSKLDRFLVSDGSKNGDRFRGLGAIDKEIWIVGYLTMILFFLVDIDTETVNFFKFPEMESKDNFQKSKVKWAVEGDENSKFFHGIINKRRAQLAIRGIFVDGFWETDHDFAKAYYVGSLDDLVEVLEAFWFWANVVLIGFREEDPFSISLYLNHGISCNYLSTGSRQCCSKMWGLEPHECHPFQSGSLDSFDSVLSKGSKLLYGVAIKDVTRRYELL